MNRRRRLLIGVALPLVLVVIVASAGFSLWLSWWVPTHGKAWVERRLEERLPYDVTIGALRYSLWRGVLLEDVSAFDEATRTLWIYAPAGAVRINLWTSLWRRAIAFDLTAELRAPVPTDLRVSGALHPRSERLQASFEVSKIAIKEMIPELAQRLPAPLTASGLPWEAHNLKGAISLDSHRVAIHRLQGTTFSFPWELHGTIDEVETPNARFEVFLQTRGELSSLPAELLKNAAAWQPAGSLELTLTCRGPVRDWAQVEIAAQAIVRDGTLAVPVWPRRVDHIEARLQYDHLANTLTITSLTAAAQGVPLSMHGTVTLTSPAELTLTVGAQADLDLLRAALPEGHAVQSASGPVTVSARVYGRVPNLQWQAEAALTDGTVLVRSLTQPFERLHGTIRCSNAALTTDSLTFTYQQVPVHLSATVTQWLSTPRVEGELKAEDLVVKLVSVWRPDRLDLQEGTRLMLRGSTLEARGEISWFETGAVDLLLSGAINPADLRHVPWAKLPDLQAWDLQGSLPFRLRAVGPRNDVAGMTLDGSIHAYDLLVRGVAVQELDLTLQQADRRLTISSSRTVIAGGLVAGEYRVHHHERPSTFSVSADLTGIDLAQAAASVPAWKQRGVSGTASAHLMLSGSGGQGNRASLRGDGWINATGERLANLPLLEKVLGGMLGGLADRLGLSSMRSAQVTSIAGQWQLSQQRLVTEDLRLGALAGSEPLTLYVRGSIGLDTTLDLTVEPELSEQLVMQSSTTSTASNTVLQAMGGLERLRRMIGRHHIGGTLDKPEYKFEVSLDQIFKQLLPSLF